jgi:hypothetical protein
MEQQNLQYMGYFIHNNVTIRKTVYPFIIIYRNSKCVHTWFAKPDNHRFILFALLFQALSGLVLPLLLPLSFFPSCHIRIPCN